MVEWEGDNRRRWPRAKVSLSLAFTRSDEEKNGDGSGITRDVSAGGAYFFTQNAENIEEGDRLAIRFYGLETSRDAPALGNACVSGTVQRLNHDAKDARGASLSGVAVRFGARPHVSSYMRRLGILFT